MAARPERETTRAPVVLQYVGYEIDAGGMMSALRALCEDAPFASILGVGPSFAPRRSGLETWRLPPIAAETISLATLWRARRLARVLQDWLREDACRVFHGHSRAGLLIAWWLSGWRQQRTVATVHSLGRQTWFYRGLARRLGPRLHWLGPAMKRHYGIGGDDWDQCLPDCLPLDRWRAPVSRPPRSTLTFGCVGDLVPVKQWELVAEALARIPGEEPIRVVQVGSAPAGQAAARYERELRAGVARRQLGPRFELRGQLDPIDGFYDEIDCLIVASRWEGSSMAALEAAAAGVPVLAPDTSGTRDLVVSGKFGWLFPADRPEGLAREMLRLARTGLLRDWRRHESAWHRFTAPVVAAQHLAVYRRQLAS